MALRPRSLVGAVAVAVIGCGDTIVSETEVWRLELEQLEDGSTSFYPRRGTVTMRLRLNRTIQPDPTCEGHESGDLVTTFLADVEVFSSRLQGPATGSADGSWNCHGLTATVALNDGTRYELQSDGGEGTENPHPAWSWDGDSYDVTWTSGARRGQFSLSRVLQWDETLRESHMDVLVQNRTGRDWTVALVFPDFIRRPIRIDYTIDNPTLLVHAYEDVPAARTINLSWPAHGRRRTNDAGFFAVARYAIRALPAGDTEFNEGDPRMTCLLASDHPDEVHVIIRDDGELECGDGWVGSSYLAAARSPLFVEPDGEVPVRDTVTVQSVGLHDVVVVSTEPAITASLTLEGAFQWLLTVSVVPEAPRGEHGLSVIGRGAENVADTIFVPVHVYELDVTTAVDTLTLAPGTADTTSVLLASEAVFWDIAFSATDLPADVLQSVPSFDPTVTDRFVGVGSIVTVTVDAAAALGTYELTLCGTIVDDPLAACHPASLAFVVAEGTQDCQDFDLRIDSNVVQVAAGDSDDMPVFVDRIGGFSDEIRLGLFPAPPDFVPVGSALDSSDFTPNPVTGSVTSSTFSFAVRNDVSVGESYDFEIRGGSPNVEAPTTECAIPITFEVGQ